MPNPPNAVTTFRWPNIKVGSVPVEVDQTLRLLTNAADNHQQAFTAIAAQGSLVATVNGGVVTAVDVVSGGKYAKAPSVKAVGGGGSGASFSVNFNTQTGAIRSVKVQNGGSGYTSPPALVIST
jgi:hypothetical protein